jgi:hypothetical protein
LCVAAIVLGLPLGALAEQKSRPQHTVYEVWGTHSRRPEPWYFDRFNSAEMAARRIAQIKYDFYNEKGLLYHDPDKPVRLHIVEKRVSYQAQALNNTQEWSPHSSGGSEPTPQVMGATR